MDKVQSALNNIYNELRHYGDIVEDSNTLHVEGETRITTYQYDNSKFEVVMFNGNVISIICIR